MTFSKESKGLKIRALPETRMEGTGIFWALNEGKPKHCESTAGRKKFSSEPKLPLERGFSVQFLHTQALCNKRSVCGFSGCNGCIPFRWN